MTLHELRFDYEKTTKNTVRYQERTTGDDRPVIGPIYIQKHALGNSPPDTVKVSVQFTDTTIN
jgi:hypothetical protein